MHIELTIMNEYDHIWNFAPVISNIINGLGDSVDIAATASMQYIMA